MKLEKPPLYLTSKHAHLQPHSRSKLLSSPAKPLQMIIDATPGLSVFATLRKRRNNIPDETEKKKHFNTVLQSTLFPTIKTLQTSGSQVLNYKKRTFKLHSDSNLAVNSQIIALIVSRKATMFSYPAKLEVKLISSIFCNNFIKQRNLEEKQQILSFDRRLADHWLFLMDARLFSTDNNKPNRISDKGNYTLLDLRFIARFPTNEQNGKLRVSTHKSNIMFKTKSDRNARPLISSICLGQDISFKVGSSMVFWKDKWLGDSTL
ncbi:hypothetical protein H5410_057928 [Solanum commersonii]|uniref:Uncharacterized protein n=1 Tax=Solanum commersonii TaxID=4109 RepID=A0A9J5WQA9_SOLCO|nr:hypothetical protein H5410_057928 [Solanum commersonii]